jgi:hypothetical protein
LASATLDGFDVTTGAHMKIMIDEGFISIPEEERDALTEPMLETVVPVVLQFDKDMTFTGFEIRDSISDGDAPSLELQIEYEVIGEATEDDIPDAPSASQVTAITDEAAATQFFEKFNDRTPQS